MTKNEPSCEKCAIGKTVSNNIDCKWVPSIPVRANGEYARRIAAICRFYAEPEPSAVEKAYKKLYPQLSSTPSAWFVKAFHAARPHWRKKALEDAKRAVAENLVDSTLQNAIKKEIHEAINELAEVE